jgi:hypothetical protein
MIDKINNLNMTIIKENTLKIMDILGDLFELEPVEVTLLTENIEFLNEEQKLNQLYQQLQR